MKCYYTTFPTALGEFSVAVDESGSVTASAFGDLAALRARLKAVTLIHDPHRVALIREELQEFFAGRRQKFTLQLAPNGTAFQKRVWSALAQIPYGETISYGQLAECVGSPSAARAVGRANATNPICVLTPCHRVVGADGSLTGFAFGTEIKRRLLALEAEGRR